MNQILYTLIKPYQCKVCGKELLMFQTRGNRLMDYKIFLAQARSREEMISILRSHHIKFLRCISCEKSYLIDWTTGWPTQLLDFSKLSSFGVGGGNGSVRIRPKANQEATLLPQDA